MKDQSSLIILREFGPAGRTFKNATNIKVNNPHIRSLGIDFLAS